MSRIVNGMRIITAYKMTINRSSKIIPTFDNSNLPCVVLYSSYFENRKINKRAYSELLYKV